MKMSTNGIDLAKAVFQIRGVDNRGKIVLCKQLSRVKTKFFANLTRCLVG
jgi:transposase